ncbi:MAG: hypothetical protein KJO79_06210 [Verrucomicrobiae bacterium]|nr:hypothetical protein [Verrucomicrobiae bacterium]NNJ86755.1 hypothetical protein [Akkermansiaceae bacterium]
MKKTLQLTTTMAALAVSSAVFADDAVEEKPLTTPESEFKRLDKNVDGKLSFEELSVDRKAENARRLINKKDANQDGFLQLKECRIALVWKYPKAVFAEYDANDDGKVDLGEFSAQAPNEDKAASWFNSLDWNKNKSLSFKEFIKMRK